MLFPPPCVFVVIGFRGYEISLRYACQGCLKLISKETHSQYYVAKFYVLNFLLKTTVTAFYCGPEVHKLRSTTRVLKGCKTLYGIRLIDWWLIGTRSRSRVSGNDRLFPRGSEFGPNLEIPAGPAIQLRPGPANDISEIDSTICSSPMECICRWYSDLRFSTFWNVQFLTFTENNCDSRKCHVSWSLASSWD